MKLLFDQNLSFKLCDLLADVFLGSSQVGRMGLAAASDREIWSTAGAGGFTIVSQDADFAELAHHLGSPPKVIWLRCGNQPTAAIAGRLRRAVGIIESFEKDADAACLEVF